MRLMFTHFSYPVFFVLYGLSALQQISAHPADAFLAKVALSYNLPAAITKTLTYPEIGVVEWTLSNHMRVCVHVIESDDQEVRFQAMGPGGAFSVPSMDRASAELSADIAIESGVGNLNGAQLNNHLYDIHAELSTNVLATAHTLEGACPSEQLPTFLQLVHTLFVTPRFDKTVLSNVIEREIRVRRFQQADADARFQHARFMMNTQDASVFVHLPEESIRAIDYDTARLWYEKVFLVPQRMTVLIVGDVDITALRALVLRFLATIPASKDPLPLKGCKALPPPEGEERIKITGRTLRELEPLVELSCFPPSPKLPFPLKHWETVAQIIESTLRTAFIKSSGSTHGIDVALEFPLYPCIHPFWVTLGFRASPPSIDSLIATAKRALEELYGHGTTEKEIERALELQERNDAFWSSDKVYFIAHLASGYHFGGGPHALLPKPPPSLKEVNHLLRYIQNRTMTIGILDPVHD